MLELEDGKALERLMKILGFSELYPPQRMAVEAGVEDGTSVVVASPTASGKTFIAMLALASSTLRTGKKAFYTAPLRSIATEKYREFREVLGNLNLRVGISIGDYEEMIDIDKYNVIVTTYEKLDSMIRNSPDMLDNIASLVIDEVHYVDDDKRGPIVETLASKVLYRARDPQLVALSATISNAKEIAEWLGAKLIVSDWRPVPLSEGVYKDGAIHYADGRTHKVEDVSVNASINLVADAGTQGGQSLVFVQSRRRAVQLAKMAARVFSGQARSLLSFDERKAREAAKRLLSSEGPSALKEELAELVKHGVAYHHAGLSNEQRGIIEDAFRSGALGAIFATPTLAAGVNLPARRVVVAEYLRYEEGFWRPIKVFEYKQFAGRAGRPGLDPYGEAIIVALKGDTVEDLMDTYIRGKPERIESRLGGVRGLRHSALGAVASGLANDEASLVDLHRRTLFYRQRGEQRVLEMLRRALDDLIRWRLLVDEGGRFRATELGSVVSKTYLDPYSVEVLRRLTVKMYRVSRRTGGKPTTSMLLYLIASMPDMTYVPTTSSDADKVLDIVVDRAPELVDLVDWTDIEAVAAVKSALVMLDWVEEKPDDIIVKEYGIGPGDVASIVDTASWISSALASVVPMAGLEAEIGQADASSFTSALAGQLKVLSQRIESGVKPELLPLVSIPGIGRVRARRLYKAGFTSLDKLATARPEDLVKVPGIGPAIAANILEFFGRKEEAARLRGRQQEGGPGLAGFMS